MLSPLTHGVPPSVRERPQTLKMYARQRAMFAMHPLVTPVRDRARSVYSARKQAPSERVLLETRTAVAERRPDVLLLSAYLGHQPSVSALCELAAEQGFLSSSGGPAFNNPDTAAAWASIPGLTAIVGAEVDFTLPAIVATTLARGDLTRHEGVFLPDGRQGPPAPPLADLSRLPVPDFADFPWHLYRTAVVPVMTGRGCSWGRCLFCSDVETANGRTFRSRPVDAVLEEISQQSARHAAKQVALPRHQAQRRPRDVARHRRRLPTARARRHLGRHGPRAVAWRQRPHPRRAPGGVRLRDAIASAAVSRPAASG